MADPANAPRYSEAILRLTAMHEAAHAVMALRLGIGVSRMVLGEAAEPHVGLTTTRTPEHMQQNHIEEQILLAVAGGVAEAVAAGRTVSDLLWSGPLSADRANADRYARQKFPGASDGDLESYLLALMTRAAEMIQEGRFSQAMERLTDALVTTQRLEESEILRLVEGVESLTEGTLPKR